MEVGEVKVVSFLGLVLGNHLLQQLIEIILVLQHGLPQNGQSKKYGNQKQHQRNHGSLCRIKQPQEKLPLNLLFFPMWNPVIADLLLGSCHFSSLTFHDCRLKFSKTKSELFWAIPVSSKKNVKTLNSCFWGNMSKKPCAKLCFRQRSGH